jgi:hypothetical protein
MKNRQQGGESWDIGHNQNIPTPLSSTFRLFPLQNNWPVLSFEASNHYCYTAGDLREKVLNCEWVRNFLFKKVETSHEVS